jgi:Na+/H+ antiporter NhaC
MYGPVGDQLGKTKKLHPYRRANLLDGLACTIPPIFPITSAFIFIVVLVVNGLAGDYSFIQPISPFQMVYATFHCWGLVIAFGVSIITGWGRVYEGKDGEPVKTLAGTE